MNELLLAMMSILVLAEDSSTDNLKENAIGIYQIRPIFVEDVNRIVKLHGGDEVYKHEDARNARKAQQMIFVYLKYYGRQYKLAMGKEPDARVLGMIHQGGPKGYLNTSELALEYGERCANLYEQWELENR